MKRKVLTTEGYGAAHLKLKKSILHLPLRWLEIGSQYTVEYDGNMITITKGDGRIARNRNGYSGLLVKWPAYTPYELWKNDDGIIQCMALTDIPLRKGINLC